MGTLSAVSSAAMERRRVRKATYSSAWVVSVHMSANLKGCHVASRVWKERRCEGEEV